MTTTLRIKPAMTTYQNEACAPFMRSRDRFGKLSNMTFGFPLTVNEVRFQGPEGLYQALKFPQNPDHQNRIAQQRSGMEAKRVAYQEPDIRPDWERVRVHAMAYTLAVKLQHHPQAFGQELLSTGNRPIVEMSRRDDFWGAKPQPGRAQLRGTNALGQLLTALREELRRQEENSLAAVETYLEGLTLDGLIINSKQVHPICIQPTG